MTSQTVTLNRLHAALEVVATRLVENLDYAPVFERIEAEIALIEAQSDPSPVQRARRTIEARRALDSFISEKDIA